MRKMRDNEEVDLSIALKWVVRARNCYVNNGSFSPNQLVFGRNPSLPNLMGEGSSSPASREKGLEKSILLLLLSVKLPTHTDRAKCYKPAGTSGESSPMRK